MKHIAAALLLSVTCVSPASLSRPVDRPCLEAAVRAARWIERAAVTTAYGPAWPAVPPDKETIQANLYSGTAGLVLFFLDLNRAVGNPAYIRLAETAADGLLRALPEEKDLGLYTGAAGIAFVLEEAHKLTGEKRYRDGFLLGLKLIASRAVKAGRGVEWDGVTDIISGGAGIGLFLIHASRELQDPSLLALAEQAADRLIELGRPESGGLKWAMSPDFPRLMPNFSHGTAGVAYFLATLYRQAPKDRYLQAALSGAKYLLAVADKGDDGCLVFHDEPDGRDLFYLGWCHGPAGTGRLFERLYQVTGDPVWKDWLARSARSLIGSGIPQPTPGFWNNVGICCGSAGAADFLLGAYRRTGDKACLDLALRLTEDLLARAETEGDGLKWVQAEHRTRPDLLQAQTGFMQGAAGVGLWLLRLDRFLRGEKKGIILPDDPFED